LKLSKEDLSNKYDHGFINNLKEVIFA
jgi:hypothetical protein